MRVEEILLTINAQSVAGKLPDRLTPADLILAEDGSARSVTSVMRSPAHILLVVDNFSGFGKSKGSNLNRDAADSIVDSLAEDDEAAIITYGDKVELLSAWTSDKAALHQALAERFRLAAKSHLYDALVYAGEQLLPQVSGRRSIVLLTDGYDSYTKERLDTARAALDRSSATIYVLAQSSMIVKGLKHAFSRGPMMGINVATDPKFRELIRNLQRYSTIVEGEIRTLKSLAEDSGGVFWDPESPDDFKEAYRNAISEIGSEYIVAYSSEWRPDDHGIHNLSIYSSRPGLKIRTRRRLYSTPPAENTPLAPISPN